MRPKFIAERLDEFLTPLDFFRMDTTWNRNVGLFIDVIDVQTSKTGDSITVNAGVFHPAIYAACWTTNIGVPVQEPECIVRARIGDLINEHDLWWSLSNNTIIDDIVEKIRKHVLPFLGRMHSFEAMEQFLIDTQVIKKKYPPPIIYLAALKNMRGDKSNACLLLSDFQGKAVGAWQTRIREIASQLGCKEDK